MELAAKSSPLSSWSESLELASQEPGRLENRVSSLNSFQDPALIPENKNKKTKELQTLKTHLVFVV